MKKFITCLLSLFILVATFGCSSASSGQNKKINEKTLTEVSDYLIEELEDKNIRVSTTTVQQAYYFTFTSNFKKLCNDFSKEFEDDFIEDGVEEFKEYLDDWYLCIFLLKNKNNYFVFTYEFDSNVGHIELAFNEVLFNYQLNSMKIMPVAMLANNYINHYIDGYYYYNDEYQSFIDNHKNAGSTFFSVSTISNQSINNLLK